ncbi:MAG: cadherin domain-containing protein, partial [Marinomonas sp.]
TVDSATSTVNLDITAVNDTPTLNGAPTDITVTEDVASNVDLSAVTFADLDGDNLTVTLTASAGTLAATSSGSVTVGGSSSAMTLTGTAANINAFLDTASNIQYTSAANANGDDAATLTIKANDGTVDSATSTVNLDITAVNDAPVISSGSTGTVTENAATSTVIYTATATDAESDTINYSLTGTDAALLSINTVTGEVTLNVSADYETKSSYSFNVIATDNGTGNLNSSQAVTVSVSDVNDSVIITVEPPFPLPSEVIVETLSENVNTVPPNIDLTLSELPDGIVSTDTGESGFTNERGESDSQNIINDIVDEGGETPSNPIVSASSVAVNIGADGQVQVTQTTGSTFSNASLTIANMIAQSDSVQLTVADTGLKVSYSGTLADGTDLPSWVSINPSTGEITLTPPKGEESITLKINALDENGETRVLEVEVDLANLPEELQIAPEKADAIINNSVGHMTFGQQLELASHEQDNYGRDLMTLLVS